VTLLESATPATDSQPAAPTPSAMVAAALARIADLEPEIRAFAAIDVETALAAARRLEARAGHSRPRPLLGWPVAVKDLLDAKGLPAAYGSPLYGDHRPQRDATVVRRLRRAGAVIVGKTVTTEFGAFDPPQTRNPWDPACTPGGSSSGSAAAVASGMVRAAIGTQTAGSTLRPASYCGVIGFMPSPGWIGRTGSFTCSWSLDRIGLLAGNVEDVGALLDGTLGLDPHDPMSVRRPTGRLEPLEALTGVRIGLFDRLIHAASEPMRAAVRAAAGTLADAGADVRSMDGPAAFAAGHAAHLVVMYAEMAAAHEQLFSEHAASYGPRIRSIIESGLRVRATDYLRAQRLRREYRRQIAQLFREVDALLAPAAVSSAERDLSTIGDPFMNIPATFAGLPAIALPAAVTADGLPLGIQLIGARDDDWRLLALAQGAERLVRFDRSGLEARLARIAYHAEQREGLTVSVAG
jgi:aspartyl-tRNA(Asn)/glutamyl-tRNA(Gln) amidotransferase subunit A